MRTLITNSKWRWFTSLVVITVLTLAGIFLVAPRQQIASVTPNFPTYTTGSFTFSTPQALTHPPIPVTPGVFLKDQDVEPEVKVDIFGNIYVTAIHGVPGGIDLWKSIDKGATFVYMGEPDGAQDKCNVVGTEPCVGGVGGGDDSLDLSSDGYFYLASLYLGNTTMSVSYDGGAGGVLPGQKWEVNPASAGVPVNDRQWIAAYGPQTLYMTFDQAPAPGPLWFVKSTDTGKTFGAPMMLTGVSVIERENNVAVDQYSGNIYTTYFPSGSPNQLALLRSTDGGATWTTVTAYTGPAGTCLENAFAIIAVDRGGNVHIGFTQSTGCTARTNAHVLLISTANPTAATPTWTTPVQIDNAGASTGSTVMPWIVAGSPGVVDVTWYGSSMSSPDNSPANSSQYWNVYFAQVTNALTGSPTISSQQIVTSVHNLPICSRGGNCSGNTRDLAEYYTVTIDRDGNAHIAYVDEFNYCAAHPAANCFAHTYYMKQTAGPSAYALPAAPAPATFAANLTLPGSGGAAEPSIAVDSHNCIYGSAPGTYFWASENAGLTFRNTTVPPVILGGDEDVATIPQQTGARNDALYYADLALADIDIWKSTDRGNTWTSPGTGGVAGNFNPSSDRQWIAGDRINSGANQILWELDHEFTTEQIRISASIDDSAWGTTSGEVDPELANTTENTNPGNVFVDKSTHTMHGVFAGSTISTNAADPPYGKEPNYWEVVATAPPAGGLPPVNVANYAIFRGLIDSPTTAPAGTTTYGSHVAAIFPAGAADAAGNIYAVWTTLSARPNASIPPGTNNATTWDIWFGSSHDGGKTFYGPFKISSGTGTAIFPWIDAGDAGRVDIVWYQSNNPAPPLVSDPSSPGQLTGGPNNMPAGSTWNVIFAQSLNANSREPVFAVTTASDHIIHNGSISIGGLTGSADRSLLDYFKVAVGPDGLANIMSADNGTSGLHINYMRQNGGPLALTSPSSVSCVLGPTSVVSRKTHGTAGDFDVPLPLTPHGIECRAGQPGATDHKVVFTFDVPVTVSSASVSSGTGSVSSFSVSGNVVTVNLTGVANAQTIMITLTNVSNGTSTVNITWPMDVLLGDTTANKAVNSSDISQTKAQSGTVPTASTFRTDVTVNGLINSSDISTVKSKSGTAIP